MGRRATWRILSSFAILLNAWFATSYRQEQRPQVPSSLHRLVLCLCPSVVKYLRATERFPQPSHCPPNGRKYSIPTHECRVAADVHSELRPCLCVRVSGARTNRRRAISLRCCISRTLARRAGSIHHRTPGILGDGSDCEPGRSHPETGD